MEIIRRTKSEGNYEWITFKQYETIFKKASEILDLLFETSYIK